MSFYDFTLAVISRGINISPFLAGLVFHTPINLVLVVDQYPTDTHSVLLMETLRRLGCSVKIIFQNGRGMGAARVQSVEAVDTPYTILMDDDMLLNPPGGFVRLMNKLKTDKDIAFVQPFIRYPANFIHPEPHWYEIWDYVELDDPRVQMHLLGHGAYWKRIFDNGEDQDIAYGTFGCLCAETDKLYPLIQELEGHDGAGEDRYVTSKLGRGRVISGIDAIHFGASIGGDQGLTSVAREIYFDNPELFHKYAIKVGQHWNKKWR